VREKPWPLIEELHNTLGKGDAKMPREFKVISGTGKGDQESYTRILPEERLRHFRNVAGSVLQDALDTWADIWNELQGSVTHGVLVSAEVKDGYTPPCGWPEFLERMWVLRHDLDYVKRLCEGKDS
jgi:hypothetical protein